MDIQTARAWEKANWGSETFDNDKYLEAIAVINGFNQGVRAAADVAERYESTRAGVRENIIRLIEGKG